MSLLLAHLHFVLPGLSLYEKVWDAEEVAVKIVRHSEVECTIVDDLDRRSVDRFGEHQQITSICNQHKLFGAQSRKLMCGCAGYVGLQTTSTVFKPMSCQECTYSASNSKITALGITRKGISERLILSRRALLLFLSFFLPRIFIRKNNHVERYHTPTG